MTVAANYQVYFDQEDLMKSTVYVGKVDSIINPSDPLNDV